MKHHMAEGVTRRFGDLEPRLAHHHHIAVSDHAVQRRDLAHLFRPDDFAGPFCLQPRVALGVIGVPVGVQDQIQPPPAQAFQLLQNPRRVRRIDRRDRAGCRIADQKAVVVAAAGKQMHIQGHAPILAAGPPTGL